MSVASGLLDGDARLLAETVSPLDKEDLLAIVFAQSESYINRIRKEDMALSALRAIEDSIAIEILETALN